MKLIRILSAFCLFAGVSAVWASLDEDWVRAVGKRDVAAIERLVKHGVDVNLSTADGKTALMLAAQQGRVDLIRALLDAGATINLTNTRGGTALMYAAVVGDPATVKLLLLRGATINTQSSNGWTALMIAAVKGYDELVRLLLARGADPNLRDIYGWTPLMRAAYENRLTVVRALLASNATKVNVSNDNGATALHQAARRGHLQIVQLLIDHGADLEAKDLRERTPAMLARAQGHANVANMINGSLEKKVSR
jgi:ankyrin repeat protein